LTHDHLDPAIIPPSAAHRALGLDGPKICAQVKSSGSAAGVNVLRELQGSMSTFKADQGLLVSWGGFTTETQREARQHHFSVRLWDASNLLDALVQNYDRLPKDLRTDLPLKKIWALVLED
jgi:restriction system protein